MGVCGGEFTVHCDIGLRFANNEEAVEEEYEEDSALRGLAVKAVLIVVTAGKEENETAVVRWLWCDDSVLRDFVG